MVLCCRHPRNLFLDNSVFHLCSIDCRPPPRILHVPCPPPLGICPLFDCCYCCPYSSSAITCCRALLLGPFEWCIRLIVIVVVHPPPRKSHVAVPPHRSNWLSDSIRPRSVLSSHPCHHTLLFDCCICICPHSSHLGFTFIIMARIFPL